MAAVWESGGVTYKLSVVKELVLGSDDRLEVKYVWI